MFLLNKEPCHLGLDKPELWYLVSYNSCLTAQEGLLLPRRALVRQHKLGQISGCANILPTDAQAPAATVKTEIGKLSEASSNQSGPGLMLQAVSWS